MPPDDTNLESLTQVMESLQDAIRRHGSTIGANETRTRNTLIDPILRALGWTNASLVTQEYLVRYGPRESDYGVVDYALHPSGDRANPTAFLEAKRMSEDLTDEHRTQVLDYVLDKGGNLRQFALTNGDQWEMYELINGEPVNLFKLSILKQPASECASLFLGMFPLPNLDTRITRTEAHAVTPRYSDVISPASEVVYAKAVMVRPGIDLPKVATFFFLFFMLAVPLSYFVGLSNSGVHFEGIAWIGVFAALFILSAGLGLALRLAPDASRSLVQSLLMKRLRRPLDNRSRTLWFVLAAMPTGLIVGAVAGFLGGYASASVVAELFAALGMLVVWSIIFAVIALFAIGLLNRSNKKKW